MYPCYNKVSKTELRIRVKSLFITINETKESYIHFS